MKYAWPVCIGCLLIIGATIIVSVPADKSSQSLWIAMVAGAIVAILGGPALLTPILYAVRKHCKMPWGDSGGGGKAAHWVGLVERGTVFFGIVLGYGQYVIGGWIALKTISQWKGWEEQKQPESQLGKGRTRFYLFLIGTALSIACAAGGALYSYWLLNPGENGVKELFHFGLKHPPS